MRVPPLALMRGPLFSSTDFLLRFFRPGLTLWATDFLSMLFWPGLTTRDAINACNRSSERGIPFLAAWFLSCLFWLKPALLQHSTFVDTQVCVQALVFLPAIVRLLRLGRKKINACSYSNASSCVESMRGFSYNFCPAAISFLWSHFKRVTCLPDCFASCYVSSFRSLQRKKRPSGMSGIHNAYWFSYGWIFVLAHTKTFHAR